MPASPTTRKDRPRPPTASSRPARSSTSSYCRPTKTDSVRWWGGGIAEIIPLSCARGLEHTDAKSLPEARMKFDLLYELQMPKPHDERSEYRCYHEALEQIVLADQLGFDTVWEVEHHFLTEFAHSSAPEIFLTAVSQHTKRIRIGHGVVLLPHQFNHPIRVAERVAALDIMSDGRAEFGTGRSSQYEQGGFQINTDLSRDMW